MEVSLKKKQKEFLLLKYLSKDTSVLYTKKFDKKKLLFLKKLYNYNFKKKVVSGLLSISNFSKKINVKVVQNNLFCTFSDLKNNRVLHTSSSGVYKVKISKRKLKHFYNTVLLIFFNKIKKNCKNLNDTIFNIVAPIKLRKRICKLIKSQIKKYKFSKRKKNNILLNVVSKKCFNGCKAKKKLRKKRRLYRIYK